MKPHRTELGAFTAEAALAVGLLAVLAAALSVVVTFGFEAYIKLRDRHLRVDQTDQVLRAVHRDLRRAVPNSLRTDGAVLLEWLRTSEAARYRQADGAGPQGDAHSDVALTPGGAVQRFNLTGRMGDEQTYGALPAAARLILFPSDTVGLYSALAENADAGPVTAADAGIERVDAGDEDQIRLGRAHVFSSAGPVQHIFLADSPQLYWCDSATETLWMIRDYTVTATIQVPVDGLRTVLLRSVTDCSFGVVRRSVQQHVEVASMRLTVRVGQSEELLQLYRQVHVVNVP